MRSGVISLLFFYYLCIMEITLSMGSNTHQEKNILEAKERLRALFGNVEFYYEQWTEPIGVCSDKYLNLMARAQTQLKEEDVRSALKNIERFMGDSHENHRQGKVLIDLDLLTYGTKRTGKAIWLSSEQ